MQDKIKSLFNASVLKEEVLKEFYKLPESIDITDEEKELIEDITISMLTEWARKPFLSGVELKNCEATIRHGKAALNNVKVIKRINGEQALIYALQSVLTKSAKALIF